jgi:hypothetical protein
MPTGDLGAQLLKARRRWSWALLALAGASCASLVTAPSGVADPVSVFVLKEALHTGLVLPPTPDAAGSPEHYVEFGFGDWAFYALGDDGASGAVPAVLWPTRGALGRRSFAVSDDAALLREVAWADLTPVVVSRARAAALRRELQEAFDGARKQVIVDRRSGVKFVPSDQGYWWPNTCADVAAGWLEELGCEVAWAPVRASLYVAPRDP